MNKIVNIKKANATSSGNNSFSRVKKDDNGLKHVPKPTFGINATKREFGKDLMNPNSNLNSNNSNANYSHSTNNSNGDKKLRGNSNSKQTFIMKPLKKSILDTKPIIRNESSLYSLRPRNSVNGSKNTSQNNSFNDSNYNSSKTNENHNAMNTMTDLPISTNQSKFSRNQAVKMDIDMEESIPILKTEKNETDVVMNFMNEEGSFRSKIKPTLLSNYNSNPHDYKQIKFNFLFCENKSPQQVGEYIDDIYDYLKLTEKDNMPKYGYMKAQKDVNEKMRSILVDWIAEVHLKFKLLPETLFLTVNIIDRYIEKNEVSRNKLQLVGVSSLFIACKYEEIYPPELKDFVYITDKAYNRDDILSMEKQILTSLQFNITTPSSLRFLEIYIQLSLVKIDDSIILFSRYLLELFLVESRMLKYTPSLVAAATYYITIKIKKYTNVNGKKIDLPKISGFTEDKLKECARDICIIYDNADKSALQAIKNKYSSAQYLEVAKIKKQ